MEIYNNKRDGYLASNKNINKLEI